MNLTDTLYAKLLAERTDGKILEDEFGFITYRVTGTECFLIDMYVAPEARAKGHGRKLINRLDEAARELGCDRITSNIYLSDPGASNTLLAALQVGFKVTAAAGAIQITRKVEGYHG